MTIQYYGTIDDLMKELEDGWWNLGLFRSKHTEFVLIKFVLTCSIEKKRDFSFLNYSFIISWLSCYITILTITKYLYFRLYAHFKLSILSKVGHVTDGKPKRISLVETKQGWLINISLNKQTLLAGECTKNQYSSKWESGKEVKRCLFVTFLRE